MNVSLNYRSYLKDLWVERRKKNPRYSLRAMARDMGLQPSHLSGIHNGTKNLSLEKVYLVARRLGLAEKQTETLALLVQLEQIKNPETRQALVERFNSLQGGGAAHDLSVDQFKFMSEWYHIPILEMTLLEGFEFNPRNVAKRLGVRPEEAELAIERLLRLELLEKDPQGKYKKVLNNYLFKSAKPNPAFQHYHRQMLDQAKECFQTQKPEERYIASQTITVDVAQIPEAKKMLDEFRAKMVEFFGQNQNPKTETYQLGLQLFRLTQRSESQ